MGRYYYTYYQLSCNGLLVGGRYATAKEAHAALVTTFGADSVTKIEGPTEECLRLGALCNTDEEWAQLSKEIEKECGE